MNCAFHAEPGDYDELSQDDYFWAGLQCSVAKTLPNTPRQCSTVPGLVEDDFPDFNCSFGGFLKLTSTYLCIVLSVISAACSQSWLFLMLTIATLLAQWSRFVSLFTFHYFKSDCKTHPHLVHKHQLRLKLIMMMMMMMMVMNQDECVMRNCKCVRQYLRHNCQDSCQVVASADVEMWPRSGGVSSSLSHVISVTDQDQGSWDRVTKLTVSHPTLYWQCGHWCTSSAQHR